MFWREIGENFGALKILEETETTFFSLKIFLLRFFPNLALITIVWPTAGVAWIYLPLPLMLLPGFEPTSVELHLQLRTFTQGSLPPVFSEDLFFPVLHELPLLSQIGGI